MKQNYEALTSANAKRDDLMKQRDLMVEAGEKNGAKADELSARLAAAEAAHHAIEKQHIRGLVSDDELTASKKLTNSLHEKLTETKRLVDLARDEVLALELEIANTQKLVQTVFAKYCNGVKGEISSALGADTKIRAKLLEAYAAMVTAGTGYSSVWHGFLFGIFPEPSRDEIKSAVDEFISEHRLR